MVAAFAFVVGLNDGSPLIAHTAAAGARTPMARALALAVAVALLPALVSSEVARTYADGVVDLRASSHGTLVAAVAVLVATVVVIVLHRAHRPTSLTLALIGSLAGAAAGAGLAVGWAAVARVLGLGVAAPLVALVLGFVTARCTGLLNGRAPAQSTLAFADRIGFGLQSLAYSLNDGQKVLLVPLVLLGTGALTGPTTVLAVTAGFAAGALVGLARAGRAASIRVVPPQPRHVITVEVVSAVIGAGGAALGTPLSMSQTCAGANVGSGVADGLGRVRWSIARTLGTAWLLTLPLAAATALLATRAVLGLVG